MDDQTENPEAVALKARALSKLAQAAALLDAAREDMANLEGVGYCDKYEKLATIRGQLTGLACSFKHLRPPTGVFKI